MLNYNEWMAINKDRLDPNKQYTQAYIKGMYMPYVVVDDGTVISLYKDKVITPTYEIGDDKNTNRYGRIKLYFNGTEITTTIHRLVWSSFMKDDTVTELDHLDFNPRNNSLSNLRPITHSENIKRSVEAGHIHPPRRNDKRTYDKVVRVCELLSKGGLSFIEIAKKVDFTEEYVKQIYLRNVRTDVSCNYKWANKKYIVVTREQAKIICKMLESPRLYSIEEIANMVDTIPHFVELIKDKVLHKDIATNRRFNPVSIDNIPLYSDERICIATYKQRKIDKYITDSGRVFNYDGTPANIYTDNDGILSVSSKYIDNGDYIPAKVVIMVAESFVPNPEGYKYVGFRDLNQNNIAYDNLIWMTETERRSMKSKSPETELTIDKVKRACELIVGGLPNSTIAKKVGLTGNMVKNIRDKNIVRWISDNYFTGDVKRVSNLGRSVRRFTLAEKYDMMDMVEHGLTPSEAASKYNSSKEYVNGLLKGKHLSKDEFRAYHANKNLVVLCGRHKRKKYSRKKKNQPDTSGNLIIKFDTNTDNLVIKL